MKGDKNMLYFYNFKVLGQEVYAAGVIECDSKITTVDEFKGVRQRIRQEVVKTWRTKFPNLQVTENDVVMLNFNPL